MKVKKSKKFASDTQEMLNVALKDTEGNPIENEKELTEEQVNFAAKMAHAMYKKFSASKVKKFDAEQETIQVVLPENIDEVNIDQVAEEASIARDKEAAQANEGEVTVTIEDEPTPDEECVACAEEVKEFAAKMRKFCKKAKKFDAEKLEAVKEALEEVTDAVEDIVEDETPKDPETVVEACQQFTAHLAKLKAAKKFSAEDLAELEKIEDHIEQTVEEINDTVVENPGGNADGVADIKKFCATAISSQMGKGSIDQFKKDFFAKK